MASLNVIKKLMALSIMQTSLILLYICLGYRGPVGVSPVYRHELVVYTNPLPQVLMLTAIVVGLAVSAVGFALCIKLKQNFGTRNSRAIDALCKHDRLYVTDGVRIDLSATSRSQENEEAAYAYESTGAEARKAGSGATKNAKKGAKGKSGGNNRSGKAGVRNG